MERGNSQQQQPSTQRLPRQQQPGTQDTPLLLLELGLQSLIYAEAANLRHTPHLLFLIYYIMRGSQAFEQVCRWWKASSRPRLWLLCCGFMLVHWTAVTSV